MIRSLLLMIGLVLPASFNPLQAAELIGDTSIIGRPHIIIAPEYPADALAQQTSGKLAIELTIDAQGLVQEYQILESTPPGVFDGAFAAVHKQWVYYPLIKECKTVPGKVVTNLYFEVKDGKPSISATAESSWQTGSPKLDGEHAPIYTYKPNVGYPDSAMTNRQNGIVLARFERDGSNRAKDPEIIFSRPAKVFDQTALKFLRRALLRPLAEDSTEDRVVCQCFVFRLSNG